MRLPRPTLLLFALACRAPKDSGGAGEIPWATGEIAFEHRSWSGEELVEARLEQWPPNRGPGLAIMDIEGDGWLDLVVALPLGGSRVLHNDGTGQLWLGPPRLPSALAVAAGDLDADGDADLVFAGQRGEPDRVLYNDGTGEFHIEELPNSEGESKTVSLVDLDGDRALDIFIGGFTPEPRYQDIAAGEQVGDGSQIFLQSAGGEWVDRSDLLPPELIPALTYHALVLDADGDGSADLYVVNDYGPEIEPNALLLNQGGGRLQRAEDCQCELAIKGMGGAIGDVDGSGRPDLFVTDVGAVHLLRSESDGRYLAVGDALGLPGEHEPGTSWGAAFVDLDLDTYEDLAVAYGHIFPEKDSGDTRDLLLRGGPEGPVEDVSAATGFQDDGLSRVVAVGDLDRDGRPDLVTAGIAWLAVRYNRGGYRPGVTLVLDRPEELGSRVQVQAGERSYTRWMLPSTMYGSHAPELYLGLGEAQRIDLWIDGPGGSRELFGVAPGERIE